MTQHAAQIEVLKHELNTLRGLRLSPDSAVAEAAVRRERELEKELHRLEVTKTQPELGLAVHQDAA